VKVVLKRNSVLMQNYQEERFGPATLTGL